MNVLTTTTVLLVSLLTPTPGPGGIPTILQQVRIGNVPLIPDTAMSPPIALIHPPPLYTTEALEAEIEGTVTVKAEFDVDGNIEVIDVVKRLGYGLDERAVEALERWEFRPAYRSGRRVAVVANVDVEFRRPVVREGVMTMVMRVRHEEGSLGAMDSVMTINVTQGRDAHDDHGVSGEGGFPGVSPVAP